jgi:hypothetical protein
VKEVLDRINSLGSSDADRLYRSRLLLESVDLE